MGEGEQNYFLAQPTYIQWNFEVVSAKGLGKLVCYIEVLFHTLHDYWAEKYCFLHRGLP